MFPSQVWNGLDRQSFFENAILLSDLKHRSQGPPIKTSRNEIALSLECPDYENGVQERIPSFLDDLALVASGAGGPTNVTAACLESRGESLDFTLRVARNESPDRTLIDDLTEMVEIAAKSQSDSQ